MNRRHPRLWAYTAAVAIMGSTHGNAANTKCQDLLTGKDIMLQDQRYKTDQDMATLYGTGYDVFLKRTNFRERVEEKVAEYLRGHADRLRKTNGLVRILEIGCGNGEMTVRYVRALRAAMPDVKIQIDLLEPAKGALREASAAVSSIDSKIEARSFPATMDEFATSHAFQAAQYDWIIGSYVFYHISPTVIPALLERLSQEGLMMVAMGSPKHPLREPAVLNALSKHGDSRSVASVLETDVSPTKFCHEIETIHTDVDLNGLWERSAGTTTDGTAFFSFIYNQDLQRFSAEQRGALDDLLTTVFQQQDGKVHPEHHLFWIWRK